MTAGRVIVKVQRPLAGAPEWLIYNEDRTVFFHAVPDESVRRSMGNRYKCYAWATVSGDTINLHGEAPEQDW